MNILYVTTIGSTMDFFKMFIKQLVDEGHTVDIATNENISKVSMCYRDWGCTVYQIDTSRSPLNKGNIMAIRQLKALVERKNYDIVHCHTPVAAMCTRLACIKARKNGVKVFYTAHGFHFFKGAPLKNWLLYYPVEKLCAHFTDTLITINKEDYAFAQKKIKAKCVEYVPGVGLDLQIFSNTVVDRASKRKGMDIPEDAVLLLSVGELNANKNHQVIVKAMAQIPDTRIHYMIAGKGESKEDLERLSAELKVADRVHLLGFRTDVNELYAASDIFCFPSRREGLGLAAIEAMACGLPILTSNVHGINDYSQEGVTGYKCAPDDVDGFAGAISRMLSSAEERQRMGQHNREAVRKYDINAINERMKEIYQRV